MHLLAARHPAVSPLSFLLSLFLGRDDASSSYQSTDSQARLVTSELGRLAQLLCCDVNYVVTSIVLQWFETFWLHDPRVDAVGLSRYRLVNTPI